MTYDSLLDAAREHRLVSDGVGDLKSWLEGSHQTVNAAVEKVGRPFADPINTMVGVADNAISCTVAAVEEKVYKPVLNKNGAFTITGAVEVANEGVTDLAKTTYASVQKNVVSALSTSINYVLPGEEPESTEPEEPTFSNVAGTLHRRLTHKASGVARNVKSFGETHLPSNVVNAADNAVSTTQTMYGTACSNAKSAAEVTKAVAFQTWSHAMTVHPFFGLPKELGSLALQLAGLQPCGPLYNSAKKSLQEVFSAYKRLLLFQCPEQ
uniref:Uncharacterized protein n=2 Tax=Spongospora subterranea TaxID=70186 RepID=A0A0H5R3W0_9EUKA|eukprot:CRZ08813.1 hypothetical protein [Spongospora subterranea]